jgi:hypothetical protein
MGKTSVIKSIFLLLLSPALFAAPVKFQGKGLAHFQKTGKKYQCTEVFMHFETTSSKFKVFEGGYDCSPLKASYDPFTLEIKSGKLYEKGEVVGDISSRETHLKKYDASDDSTFHLNLKLSPSEITYTEQWIDGQENALLITARLKRLK